MADTQVLGTCVFRRAGSSPASRTLIIAYFPVPKKAHIRQLLFISYSIGKFDFAKTACSVKIPRDGNFLKSPELDPHSKQVHCKIKKYRSNSSAVIFRQYVKVAHPACMCGTITDNYDIDFSNPDSLLLEYQ